MSCKFATVLRVSIPVEPEIKENIMSEQSETKGKRPKGNLEGVNVAQGAEKQPQAEVSGHAAGRNYICWNCGARNWVPGGYDYFICWRCGAINWI